MEEEDFVRRLTSWSTAVTDAAGILKETRGVDLQFKKLQSLAMLARGVDVPEELLEEDWTAAKLVALVSRFELEQIGPVETIEFKRSLLPSDVPHRLDEEIVKHKGEVWEIHRYDPDPFPSSPHAHNCESGYKLDLSTGDLYLRRAVVGHMQRKDLIELRGRIRAVSLPVLKA